MSYFSYYFYYNKARFSTPTRNLTFSLDDATILTKGAAGKREYSLRTSNDSFIIRAAFQNAVLSYVGILRRNTDRKNPLAEASVRGLFLCFSVSFFCNFSEMDLSRS